MKQDTRKSIEACAEHYGENADAMRSYLLAGEKQAYELNNRGPIEYDENGNIAQHILDAYSEYGFYIFENVLGKEELADISNDLKDMRASFPTGPNSNITATGKPALGADHAGLNLLWSKPLGDPLGGTDLANGRHQIKLFEPKAKTETPEWAPFVLMGSLQFSETALRVYGHPDLLRVAEAVNGKDFAPFHECLFIKDPGVGAAVSWHQDGDTHWDDPNFDEGIHGFNFMAQLHGSTAVNGVWVQPGSHKLGRIDIKALVEQAGSERIANMVPLVCNAGDVVICNRQILHGSFPNTGFEPRLTINFGFHRRSSVLDVQGAGMHSEAKRYDDKLIEHRARTVGYAINARKQRFPDEQSYIYQPLANNGKDYHWSKNTMADLKDYNLDDISI